MPMVLATAMMMMRWLGAKRLYAAMRSVWTGESSPPDEAPSVTGPSSAGAAKLGGSDVAVRLLRHGLACDSVCGLIRPRGLSCLAGLVHLFDLDKAFSHVGQRKQV